MPPNINNSLIESRLKNCNKKSNKLIEKKKNINSINKHKKWFKFFFNFLFFLSLLILFLIGLIIFVPWEDWVFNENEIQNYLDMYNEAEGEWVVRQFLATSEQNLTQPIYHEVNCYEKGYKMEKKFNAAPQNCGIVVTDSLLNTNEIERLRYLANRITEEISFQSYANRESINLKWMNLHILFRKNKNSTKKILKSKDFKLIKKASIASKKMVAQSFNISEENLYFYIVSQFTRYRSVVPFSEFRHVDKVRSPALVVTSILWLSTTELDFGGGRVEFLNANDPEPFTPLMIEPKTGRFAAWTSGWENPHGVMEVYWGDRLALIFAFTVNPKLGYKDLEKLKEYSEFTKDVEY